MLRVIRFSRLASAVVMLGLVHVAPGHAGAQDGCDGWFPDLRGGCQRPARPPGSAVPMGLPFLFEDPAIRTSVSIWGLWHDFPESSVFEGGDVRAVAVQLRLAVTERLAFIATKDGWINLRPDLDLLDSETGLGDLGLGFKYAVLDRPEQRLIVTPSLRYELTQGSSDVLQGNGEGVWVPAVSAGIGAGAGHLLLGGGLRLPVDGDAEASILFYNVQYGYPLTSRLVPFVGINGLRYVDDGDGSTRIRTSLGALPVSTVQTVLDTPSFNGLDVANLGSDDVEDQDFVSLSLGLRFQIRDGLNIGLMYERPLTRRRGIMKQRATLNILLEL